MKLFRGPQASHSRAGVSFIVRGPPPRHCAVRRDATDLRITAIRDGHLPHGGGGGGTWLQWALDTDGWVQSVSPGTVEAASPGPARLAREERRSMAQALENAAAARGREAGRTTVALQEAAGQLPASVQESSAAAWGSPGMKEKAQRLRMREMLQKAREDAEHTAREVTAHVLDKGLGHIESDE